MLGTAALVVSLATGPASGQITGRIAGRVLDGADKEPLVLANIVVVGTEVGAVSTTDGSFVVDRVPAGRHLLRARLMGYEPAEAVVVVEADATAQVDFRLRETIAKAMDEVKVNSKSVRSTDASVIAARMKAPTIGDAVSAEQIARSGDATGADALRRVTGLNVVDEKFVFVRGVSDRYNLSSLDGVSVSSTDTDVDKRSFTFDIVPASLLTNATIVKTAAPNLPGDFSGGLIQLNTLDFPVERTVKLSLSSGYDDHSIGQMLRSRGGSKDWLGIDDGSRDLPGQNLLGNDLAQALPNTWSPREVKAPLNGSYSLAYGDRLVLGRHDLGVVAALTYRASYQTAEFQERPTFMGYPLFSFEGTRDERSVLWAGILNLAYSPARNHRFALRTNHVQSAEDKVSVYAGMPASGEYSDFYTIEWDERSLSLAQLSGSHQFEGFHKLGVEWKAFGSLSDAEEPDRKHVQFEQGAGGHALKENYRTWAALSEKSHGAAVDITLPVGSATLKAGVLTEHKEREYDIDAYTSDPSNISGPYYGILVLPLDSIFAPENYGPGKLNLIPVTVFTGEYDGKQQLDAYYGMFDHSISSSIGGFRLVGGVRVERCRQTLNTVEAIDDRTPLTARIDDTDPLPSANLAYSPAGRVRIRLGYGHSVNRPEFREMANVLYYDFDKGQNVKGNPALKRAFIRNYDARVEVFPNSGEVLAVSYFYKDMTDAIEERLIPAAERYLRTWFNSPRSINSGWELEVRKSLGFIWGGLKSITVGGNYTRVNSAIEYTEAKTDQHGGHVMTQKTRLMQGQSPWTLNLVFLAELPRTRTSFSVFYNRIGRRLDAVGDTRDQDVYEESRDIVDLSVTQKFNRRFELRVAAKNVAGADEVLTSGPERGVCSKISRGTAYAVSLGIAL